VLEAKLSELREAVKQVRDQPDIEQAPTRKKKKDPEK
jgi:hypothetical protein